MRLAAGVKAFEDGLPADAAGVGWVVANTNTEGAAALDVSKAKLVYDFDLGNGQGFPDLDSGVFDFGDGDSDHKGRLGRGGLLSGWPKGRGAHPTCAVRLA